ncbi:hypothetical protein HDV00_012086, partial [Rhizophlyctis rosea]
MYGFREGQVEDLFKWVVRDEFYHPDDREAAKKAFREHYEGKTDRYDTIFRGKMRDGKYKWIHARGMIIDRDENGKPKRVIGTSMDVTAQRQLEADVANADRRMRQILNLAPVGILQWGVEGGMVFANKAAITLTGGLEDGESAGEDELDKMGIKRWNIIDPEDYASVQAGLDAASRDMKPFTSMFRLARRTSEGGVKWVRMESSALTDRDGGCEGFLAALTDLTELKDAERKLKSALKRAEIASLSKDEFLANMSHEVRTPLNGIIGLISLLQDTDLDSLQREWVDNIKTSADCLLQIVNDILDFSKIEAGKLELHYEPFDLSEVVGSVMNLFHIKATEKSIHFSVGVEEGVPKWVVSDAGRLRQVLVNLVGNAVKFMSSGSLEVTIANHNNDYPSPPNQPPLPEGTFRLHFIVKDTGIGIAADKIEKLFKPFEQGDASTSRSYGGTGLGLCISKRLVEMLGGTIGVRSEESVGSEFWFNIVVQQQRRSSNSDNSQLLNSALRASSGGDGGGKQQQSDAGAGLMEESKRKMVGGLEVVGREVREGAGELEILVAEDNMINQKLLGQLLRRLSCHATFANNGLETLETFQQRLADDSKPLFNVILMDMQMPKMDGLEATREIRRVLREREGREGGGEERGRGRDGEPIIVAVTANAMEKDRKNCLDAGMDMFLTKPIKLEAFVDVLKECLRMVRAGHGRKMDKAD